MLNKYDSLQAASCTPWFSPDGGTRSLRSMLEHANWYVGFGFAVLPLHWPVQNENRSVCSCGRSNCGSPAKHPFAKLVANGLKDATKNRAVVERWFRNTRLSIGIATGQSAAS